MKRVDGIASNAIGETDARHKSTCSGEKEASSAGPQSGPWGVEDRVDDW